MGYISSTRLWRPLKMLAALIPLSLIALEDQSGWFKAGSHPGDYDMGVDTHVAYTGTSSGYIKNKTPEPRGFGTYMQMFDVGEYRGKRLRLTCYTKAQDVEDWAGVWMRIDRDQKPVAFDNMQKRPIRSTQPWTKQEIVLDVDPKATGIALGILLSGKGTVWIDDVSLEAVSNSVPVTDMYKDSHSDRPRNLDFEGKSDKN